MARFADKVVIITGAASGIGAGCARRFAAEGATLSLADLDAAALDASAVTLGLAPDRLLHREVDVADGSAVAALVAATVERFQRLDVLVNNAGIGGFGHVTEIEIERWHRVMAVDLDAVFYASRAAIPHLKATRGAIVNTASISGLFGDSGFAAYNTAKGAVVNLTRAMAIDHAKDGVRVNAVCPGLVVTPLARHIHGQAEVLAEYEKRVPMGRPAQPDEIAAAIAFLASADASYITGAMLVVDGGLTAGTGQPDFHRLLKRDR
jgi:meso-butanediol dehydrogenase/(S,S)-butanediol dehydrogenase/diacetyl reductase